eukprot:57032-Hanusia_phi.AAC.4
MPAPAFLPVACYSVNPSLLPSSLPLPLPFFLAAALHLLSSPLSHSFALLRLASCPYSTRYVNYASGNHLHHVVAS